MTPSEVLTAAADRVRDLAAAATQGEWESSDTRSVWNEIGPVASAGTYEDAAWIAALSPAVAGHLEVILREYARCAAELNYAVDRAPEGAAALGLARAVLGEDQP